MAAASATCMANRVGWTRSMPVTVSGADIASVTENPASRAIKRLRLRDACGEHRFTCQQFRAHRGPLRTLPGEHPHRAPVVLAHRGRIRRFALGDVAQLPGQLGQARGHHSRTHRPVRTPTRQGVGQIRWRHAHRRGRSTHSASRRELSAQFLGRGGRQRKQQWVRHGRWCVCAVAAVSGACSSTAWTFVPDIPYDDTAARRGRLVVTCRPWRDCLRARTVRCRSVEGHRADR